jgi:hypothetical protein
MWLHQQLLPHHKPALMYGHQAKLSSYVGLRDVRVRISLISLLSHANATGFRKIDSAIPELVRYMQNLT